MRSFALRCMDKAPIACRMGASERQAGRERHSTAPGGVGKRPGMKNRSSVAVLAQASVAQADWPTSYPSPRWLATYLSSTCCRATLSIVIWIFLSMAPKRKVSELGKPAPHGNGWRAQAKLDSSRSVYGPQRLTRAEAEKDLEEARRCQTREEFERYLDSLKHVEAPSGSSKKAGQRNASDGRRSNSGQLKNKGGRGRPKTKSGPSARRVELGKYVFRRYQISGLDLTWARRAQELHQWPDQCCVDALMRRLEEGSGSMQFSTHFHRELYMGRLWSEWPTPLHVNRGFRAALFWPLRAQYKDVDMTGAHNHIAVYLGQTVGMSARGIAAYLGARSTWHGYLLEQGIGKAEVKQLWVSLLNGGTVAGWKRKLKTSFGLRAVDVPELLREHLALFRRDARALRGRLLGEGRWQRIHEQVCAAGGRLKKEALLRRAWSIVLGTMESQLMRELEDIAATFSATVAMPSYDGLLLHHPGILDALGMFGSWEKHCQEKYGYVFPLEVKDFEKDLPRWLQLVMCPRA